MLTTKQFRFIQSAAAAILWGLMMTTANAQETAADTTPEKDPRLVEAELQASIAQQEQIKADAEQAIAEARRATALAAFPATETTGIDGDVTVNEGTGYFATILAYESLDAATEIIAADVSSKLPIEHDKSDGTTETITEKAVILVDTLDLSEQAALHSFISAEFDRTIARLTSVKDSQIIKDHTVNDDNNLFTSGQEALGILSAIPSILGAGRDIAKFFQTKVTFEKTSVTLADSALTAGLISSLIDDNVSVVLPKFTTEPLTSFTARYSELELLRNDIADMKRIAEHRAEDRKRVLENDKAEADEALKILLDELVELRKLDSPTSEERRRVIALTADDGEIRSARLNVTGIANDISSLERRKAIVIGDLNAAIKEADDLTTALTTANSEGVTPYQAVGVIDAIKSNPNHALLFADIVSQGGEIQTKKTAFSGSINYIGGGVVSYILADQSGMPIAADNVAKLKTQTVRRKKPVEGLER